jgi:galactoside O-acetyltransferase
VKHNVWIGANLLVPPGVTIGFGSVIGAGSIVTRSISPMALAAGAPAQVVRRLSQGERCVDTTTGVVTFMGKAAWDHD